MIDLTTDITDDMGGTATHTQVNDKVIVINGKDKRIEFNLAWVKSISGTYQVNGNYNSSGNGITKGLRLITILDNSTASPPVTDFSDIANGYFKRWIASVTSATANTVTLSGTYSTDECKNGEIEIVSGTGVGQIKKITTNSNAGVFTVDSNWTTNPDTTSKVLVVLNCYDSIARKVYQYCLDKSLVVGIIV